MRAKCRKCGRTVAIDMKDLRRIFNVRERGLSLSDCVTQDLAIGKGLACPFCAYDDGGQVYFMELVFSPAATAGARVFPREKAVSA